MFMRLNSAGVLGAAVAAGIFLSTSLARAQPMWSPLSGEWLVTLKGNFTGPPAYAGSDKMAFAFSPGLSIRRAGTPLSFSAPDDNIGFAVIDHGWFKFGPSAKFVATRSSGDHRELTGLRDVPWSLEAGVFAEAWASPNIRLRADMRYGLHGHKGVVLDLGGDYVHRAVAWTLSGGPRLVLGSSGFAARTFGVTPAESVFNGVLPAYKPGGGVTSIGLSGAVSYDWSERWRTTVWGRYDRLTFDAGDSPIVRISGSPNQFTLGATLAYTFTLKIP